VAANFSIAVAITVSLPSVRSSSFAGKSLLDLKLLKTIGPRRVADNDASDPPWLHAARRDDGKE